MGMQHKSAHMEELFLICSQCSLRDNIQYVSKKTSNDSNSTKSKAT